MTWEEGLKRLKELRTEVDASEYRLFHFAHEFELAGTWKEPGRWASFDDLLAKENVCDSHRYRNFLAFEGLNSGRKVENIGTAAAVESIKISNTERRAKFLEAAQKRFESEGVPWSNQQAEEMRKKIGGQPAKDSNWNKKADREDELYKENIALKKEVHALKARIAELALGNGLPTMGGLVDFPANGGLMAYGSNQAELVRRSAVYVDKILKGANPADLPIEQPMRFEFVVNMKTARELGITFPNEIMLQVTEVIQ